MFIIKTVLMYYFMLYVLPYVKYYGFALFGYLKHQFHYLDLGTTDPPEVPEGQIWLMSCISISTNPGTLTLSCLPDFLTFPCIFRLVMWYKKWFLILRTDILMVVMDKWMVVMDKQIYMFF